MGAVVAAVLPIALAAPAQAAGCPCSLWTAADTPATADSGDATAVELGLRFSSDTDGYVAGLRFYKSAANTGTHIGSLWTTSGTLLAQVTFSGESTDGWQSASFPAPVPVTAGTSYVISYHTPTGHYAFDPGYFASPRDVAPLHVPAASATPNGLFEYSSVPTFPTGTFNGSNYWVDPVFTTAAATGPAPAVVATTPANGATDVTTATPVSATFNVPVQPASSAISVTRPGGGSVLGTTLYDVATQTARFRPSATLPAGLVLTATVAGALDLSGRPMTGPFQWTFSMAGSVTTCPCSLWADTVVPGTIDTADPAAVELGTGFTSDVDGTVSGVRFYKSAANTGTHIGSLWTAGGALLAQVTFAGETGSGWQQATFSPPAPITAGTPYVISYHTPTGHYSADGGYFAGGYDAAPLHARGGSGNPNGLFAYSPVPVFPTGSFNSTNYWVSPVLTPTLVSIAVTPATVSVAAGRTTQLTATGTYSDGTTASLTSGVTWTAATGATVSSTGLVTGVTTGTSTVTAKVGSISGSATVTVTAPVLTSIAVTPTTASVAAGRTTQLLATGTYSNGTTAALTSGVTWTATTGATVSSTGLVTGVTVGTSTVTAKVGTISGSTTVTVTAAVLTSIVVSPAASKAIAGVTQQLTATGTFSDGTTRVLTTGVTWTSSSTTTATISAGGALTPIAAGTTTVTATVGAVSGSTTVTVRTIRSITLSPALTLSIGARPTQITATAALSDGTTADITASATWSSTFPAVAAVSTTGLVTPKFVGVTTIRATVGTTTGISTVVVIL